MEMKVMVGENNLDQPLLKDSEYANILITWWLTLYFLTTLIRRLQQQQEVCPETW